MVSSVLVELVGDAGEAPSGTKFGEEEFKNISCCPWTTGVCEVDISGVEIKCHVTIPNVWLGTHIEKSGETGNPPKFIKSAILMLLALFWSATLSLTRPQVCVPRPFDLNPNH